MRSVRRNKRTAGETVMRTAEGKMNYIKIMRLQTARQTPVGNEGGQVLQRGHRK